MTKKAITIGKKQVPAGYDTVLSDVFALLEAARHVTVRTTNAIMTATYWEIGRRIVEYEQKGSQRAEYGETLLKRLSMDLTTLFGRGFSERNLEQMRLFYSNWPILQTASAKSGDSQSVEKSQTLSGKFMQTASAQYSI